MTTHKQVRSTEEALKLALEALEECRRDPRLKYEHPTYDKAITAIKEALMSQSDGTQPEQEPVAWMRKDETCTDCFVWERTDEHTIPLYITTPTQQSCSQRQCNVKPLNNQNPLLVFAKECVLGAYSETELADAAFRAIQAAHGIRSDEL